MTDPLGTSTFLPRRLPGLDVLRALAASAVVLGHLTAWPWGYAGARGLEGAIWHSCNQLGPWGVGIFFVLSGTCIHLPVARQIAAGAPARINVRAYLGRRLNRIYPPHAIVIGLSWLVAVWVATPPGFNAYLSVPTTAQFWAHVFMVHTFLPGGYYSINCVLWTIAIELHFYLVYPLLVRMRAYCSMEVLCGGLFVLMLGLHAVDTVLPTRLRGVLTYNFPGLLWQWVLGALVAERLTQKRRKTISKAVVIVLAAGSAIGTGLAARIPHGILLVAVFGPLAYGLVVFAAALMDAGFTRRTSTLEWIGLRSYSLYLTHPISLTMVAALILPWASPLGIIIVALGLTYLVAIIYFQLVERRFLSTSLANFGLTTPAFVRAEMLPTAAGDPSETKPPS